VIPISIPPLRKRLLDITLLANHFCEKYGMENSGRKRELAPATLELLSKYDWPGNVRELENVLQRATALAINPIIYPQDLFLTEYPFQAGEEKRPSKPENQPPAPSALLNGEISHTSDPLMLKPGYSVSEMEKKLILLTLEETAGNRTHAAQMLGISLRTLRNKLREYRLSSQDDDSEEAISA
jgi:two-component system response regulator FlrC